jgi:hypothetical protein
MFDVSGSQTSEASFNRSFSKASLNFSKSSPSVGNNPEKTIGFGSS